MQPINFEEANTILNKPENMTDEECISGVSAFSGVDNTGYPFTLTVWKPSYEDIIALSNGGVLCLKVLSHNITPVAMFTIDSEGNSNA